MIARRRIGLILLLFLLAPRPAITAMSNADLWHDAFIVLRDAPQVVVLDPDSLELAATLDVGLVPSTLAVSAPLKLLVVADGVSSRIGFVGLGDGQSRTLSLDFVPQRILFAPDGTALAAIDTIGGNLAFINAAKRSVTAQIHDLGSIGDALFSDDGRTFYVSGRIGLTAIQASDGAKRLINAASFSAFARSPNGRQGFGLRRADRLVDVFDLRHGEPLDRLPGEGSADALFVTGTGRFLLLLDSSHRQVTIAGVEPVRSTRTLAGTRSMNWAYSAWFDTIAFVASASERELLVYDLDHAQQRGSIELGAVPGPGAVTPDGSRLLVPVADHHAVFVIDASSARVIHRIPLPAAPMLVVMAGSYGLCH